MMDMSGAKLVLPILAVLLVAGCTSLPFVPGSDVINMVTTERAESPQDAVVIQKAQLSPSSTGNTIFPDQSVSLLFSLVNKDDTKQVNAKVEMFNAPSFRSNSGALCNSGNSCNPNVCGDSCTLLPGEEKQVSIDMKSPAEKDIASTITDTKIEFRATYDFVASLVYIIPVVNLEEVKARQRDNDKTEVQLSKMQSSGPLRINVELVGPPYILAEQPTIVTFKLKNVGGGSVVNSKLGAAERGGQGLSPLAALESFLLGSSASQSAEGIAIKFPAGIDVVEWPGCVTNAEGKCAGNDYNVGDNKIAFHCYPGPQETICYSASDIELFRGETLASMRFRVKGSVAEGTPFTSYTILAYAGYKYEIRDSIKTTINPFYNVA